MVKPVDSLLKFEPTGRLVLEVMEEVIIAANTEPLSINIPFVPSRKNSGIIEKFGAI